MISSAVRELAAATLTVRHFPKEGSRHEFALALAGFLLRQSGSDAARASHFVTTVAAKAGDDEISDRQTAVELQRNGWRLVTRLSEETDCGNCWAARFLTSYASGWGAPSPDISSWPQWKLMTSGRMKFPIGRSPRWTATTSWS